VASDSAAYSEPCKPNWATAISAGPGEQGQDLSMSIQCRPSPLFSAAPAISATGLLSFTPAVTKSGSTNCTVSMSEAGEDGLRATAPVTIEVSDGESAVEVQGYKGHCAACCPLVAALSCRSEQCCTPQRLIFAFICACNLLAGTAACLLPPGRRQAAFHVAYHVSEIRITYCTY
jgi:hypothetical protein